MFIRETFRQGSLCSTVNHKCLSSTLQLSELDVRAALGWLNLNSKERRDFYEKLKTTGRAQWGWSDFEVIV